nr:unnamed protein product [Timema californicum]
MRFSTHDMDHDGWEDGNCAHSHKGAWWYNGCDTSNLNGQYLNGEVPENYEYQGMYWYDWRGPSYSLMKSRISVRPRSQVYTVTESSGRTKPGDKQVDKDHLEQHKGALNSQQMPGEDPHNSQYAE